MGSAEAGTPRENWKDHVLAAAEVVGNVVPGAGAAVAAFKAIFGTPIDRRRTEFLESVLKRLGIVEERLESLEDLANRPIFVSTLMKAIEVAQRTHEREKLDALTNLVANTASLDQSEDTRVHVFLASIDALSGAHVATLRLFSSAERLKDLSAFSSVPESIATLILKNPTDVELARLVCQDLELRGFLKPILMPSVSVPPWTITSDHTTDLGRDFLRFISGA